ncbi:bifunctional diguanylate cyclase/phosphodiesterase [Aurantimonas sp. HBX-1]|uniref:putative bifunctional diguanylate cyclase/phosphodiesterase n=1 Tax=Aurantimonas sp. HBX-1 TaxID=2906072 RepID=UPI001F2B3DBC|nr:EAL domain-containing protein [Aurantimonas sp. HBX-1]UIJ70435.1 EAL domain-containing protein [Aurantimonas sp. HBX-1]
MPYPIAANEEMRLRVLADLNILDTPRERDFDVVVEIGREMLGAASCQISVIDRDRQWFKASSGLDVPQTDRDLAFCNHTICGVEPFVVEDTLQDQRFADNLLVTGAPFIRSYAGVPLFVDGFAIGSLCTVHSQPKRFTERDLARLRDLGEIAMSLLRRHQGAARLAQLASELTAQHDAVANQAAVLDVQKRIFDEVSARSKLGAWTRDLRTDRYEWSAEMYALHEVEADFMVTRASIDAFYHPDELQRLEAVVEEASRTNRPYTFEGEMVTAKGNRRHVRVTAQFQVEDGVAIRRYGTKQDITEERTRTEEITRLANLDSLTGLYNRRFFQDHLRGASANLVATDSYLDLLLLDLDGFKDINDSHGHAVGDHCLQVIAERLNSLDAEKALVARIGGDEFAMLLAGHPSSEVSRQLAEQVIVTVAKPIEWLGHTLELTTSIGITRGSDGANAGTDGLLLEADLALYAAKDAGRNQIVMFDNSLKVAAYQRFLVLQHVRSALNDGQLELYYQPKVRLSDGGHYGFEALIRWNSADGRVLAPAAFAEALVDPKLGVELGNFVIRAALDQAKRWKADGLPFGSIAINLSAAQFRDISTADFILREIAARGLSPHMLEVEVTEGVFLSRSSETVLEVCRKLKQHGVKIAFDDFGTGFASLTHLLEFPIDIIKIDRSFVSTLGEQTNSAAIVSAIIGMCRAMGLEVIAEGVETSAQADFLRASGCELAQGYLYARPLPAKHVAEWINHPEQLRA